MSDRLLELDIRLLLLRHGRQRVLQTLARLADQSTDELEQQLRATEQRPKVRRVRPSLLNLAASESKERPHLADALHTLAGRYENRTFLPQLRQVQRFLDRAGTSPGKLTSRATAGPLVIRALAKLTQADLLRLTTAEGSEDESDYGLLARAIMRSPEAEPPPQRDLPNKETKS